MCCFGYFDPEVLTHNVVEHERFERDEQILNTNYKEIHYIWKTVWVLVFVSLVKKLLLQLAPSCFDAHVYLHFRCLQDHRSAALEEILVSFLYPC